MPNSICKLPSAQIVSRLIGLIHLSTTTHRFNNPLLVIPVTSDLIVFSSLQPTKIDIPVPTKRSKKSSARYFIASNGLSRAPIETSFQTLKPATLTSDSKKQNKTTNVVAFTRDIENFSDKKTTLGSKIDIIELNAATASKK